MLRHDVNTRFVLTGSDTVLMHVMGVGDRSRCLAQRVGWGGVGWDGVGVRLGVGLGVGGCRWVLGGWVEGVGRYWVLGIGAGRIERKGRRGGVICGGGGKG